MGGALGLQLPDRKQARLEGQHIVDCPSPGQEDTPQVLLDPAAQCWIRIEDEFERLPNAVHRVLVGYPFREVSEFHSENLDGTGHTTQNAER